MVGSDLDRLAQSVRRALDRIDCLEAEKRRLETDNSVLEARLGERLGAITPASGPASKKVADAREKVLKLIELLRKCEKEL
jgi:hypothetical protein